MHKKVLTRDTVPANVFNAVQAGGAATPPSPSVLQRRCWHASDSEVAQTHPDLPGKNGTRAAFVIRERLSQMRLMLPTGHFLTHHEITRY